MLCSHLGFSQRPALTGPQLRVLTHRVRTAKREDPDSRLGLLHLMALGYTREEAQRILGLMSEENLTRQYLKAGEKADCQPVALVNPKYPALLKHRLGEDSPGCLWAKGDLSLLEKPAVAVVGSRTPTAETERFAVAAGIAAAQQGYVLVSGNAPGVDKLAQNAALHQGGSVISVVADELASKEKRENVLYLSELDYDMGFSAQRALSRNRVIHCLGQKVLVCQCRVGKGGTWNGAVNNLKKGWSPVFCFDDGTEGALELQDRGAKLIGHRQLQDLQALSQDQQSLFE